MKNINLENWSSCKEDVATLIHKHWEEVAWYKDKMELDPIWEQYQKMSDAGVLQSFIVRDEAEAIIGYALFFVVPALHYQGHLAAENDIMYIVPEHRSANLGFELLNYCRVALQSIGVSVMALKMKSDNTFHSLMHQAGFDLMEYNYTKWIGG